VAMMEEANEFIKQYNTTPIMFLDEAEQLLRSRQEKTETANSAVYQNLTSLFLLQLDAFKGILICSSNFSFKQTLFDPSLKRRFFSIIELTEPDQLVKKKILKNYFHFLTDKECSVLLDQFSNITPAEIKLLFEKFEISQIFDDPKISKFERLYRIIESEIIARETYQLNPTI
jgi:SpoVK/Ycf46/Vps4 family AAA+-type ATPase